MTADERHGKRLAGLLGELWERGKTRAWTKVEFYNTNGFAREHWEISVAKQGSQTEGNIVRGRTLEEALVEALHYFYGSKAA